MRGISSFLSLVPAVRPGCFLAAAFQSDPFLARRMGKRCQKAPLEQPPGGLFLPPASCVNLYKDGFCVGLCLLYGIPGVDAVF